MVRVNTGAAVDMYLEGLTTDSLRQGVSEFDLVSLEQRFQQSLQSEAFNIEPAIDLIAFCLCNGDVDTARDAVRASLDRASSISDELDFPPGFNDSRDLILFYSLRVALAFGYSDFFAEFVEEGECPLKISERYIMAGRWRQLQNDLLAAELHLKKALEWNRKSTIASPLSIYELLSEVLSAQGKLEEAELISQKIFSEVPAAIEQAAEPVDWDAAEVDEKFIDYDGDIIVFLGTFKTKRELNAYFEEQYTDDTSPLNKFARDFEIGHGRGYYDHDRLSIEHQGKALPVRELLSNAWHSRGFRDEAAKVAASKGIHSANTAAIIYDQECRVPVNNTNAVSQLTYIARFSFKDGECIDRE